MAIYAYADETIFTVNQQKNEFAIGYGILVSEVKIDRSVIDEALKELSQDIDFDPKKDQKTIDNEFFHASEDSKNGHSYFCRSINKNIKGVFDYTYKNEVEQKDLLNKGFTEEIFKRCLTSSTLELFSTANEVFLIIERRDTLNEKSILEWKKQLYRLYEGASYNTPSYKTLYPKLNILLKNKNEPGLQVVDFLIWASNRTNRTKPDNTWHKRIKYLNWYSYKEENDFNRAKFYLNCHSGTRADIYDYPFRFEKPKEWQDCLNAYVHIEKVLIKIEKSDFNETNIHLYKDLYSVSKKLKDDDYQLKSSDIKLIGSVYLKLFDTLPVYQNVSNDDMNGWTVLFHTKYLASMFVREDQIQFGRTRDEILRWRFKMRTEYLGKFNKIIGR